MDTTIDESARLWDEMLESPDIWIGSIESLSDKVIELNQQQLLDGLDNTGQPLPRYKHYDIGGGKTYDSLKREMNPRNNGRYDMRYSGNSFSTMRLEIDNTRYRIVGEGWAAAYNRGAVRFAKDLRGRIFGLYESDHMQAFRQQYLYPLQVELIKAFTGTT